MDVAQFDTLVGILVAALAVVCFGLGYLGGYSQ
jgi:hypothetical protein